MPDFFDIDFNNKYNCVVVIQSLGKNEDQTGEDLYNDIIARRCDKRKIISYFQQVDTKSEFFSYVDAIVDAVINKKHAPIIHFEMHAGLDGFDLASGETATWDELADRLRPMNIKMKNQLIVTVAACKGISLYQTINPMKPAPFWGVIGPKKDMSPYDLLRDYSSFYDYLLESHDVDKAFASLNINYGTFVYAIITCKMILDLLIEKAEQIGRPFPNIEEVKRKFLIS